MSHLSKPTNSSDNWKTELKVGDVVAYRFPHERDGADTPKVRPALVLEVDEANSGRRAVLAYGTTNPASRKKPYCVDVRSSDERAAASLRMPTRFNAWRRVSVSVDNSQFDTNRLGTPVLGQLEGAAFERMQRVRARIHAEHDIQRARLSDRRDFLRRPRRTVISTVGGQESQHEGNRNV